MSKRFEKDCPRSKASNEPHESSHNNRSFAERYLLFMEIAGGFFTLVSILVLSIAQLFEFHSVTIKIWVSCIGLIAAVIAFCCGWQFIEWKRQVAATKNGADRSLSAAERPYVSLASIYLLKNNDPPTVAITLDNTGRTPAFDLDSRVLWVSLADKDEVKFNAPIPASANVPIAAFVPPGGGVVLSPKIDKDRMGQLVVGKEFLYIYVQASYRGSDGQKHTYKYCGLYDPASDTFKLTPFHNSAD